MEHREMVELIRGGVPGAGGVWADLGAGTGNFTWALAELLGPAGTIHALDRDDRAIAAQEARLRREPPAAMILPRQADVLRPLGLPPLDGLLAANLLHFVRDQAGLLRRLRGQLRPGGTLLVVEYEQAFPIPWVPGKAEIGKLKAENRAGQPFHLSSLSFQLSLGRVMYAAAAVRAEESA